MQRRAALKFASAGLAWLLGSAHTPYGQWQVYRRRHLLIGTSKADPPSYPIGQRIVGVLVDQPAGEQRAGRARPRRLAAREPADLGPDRGHAADDRQVETLRDGRPPFEAFGATRLCSLFVFGDHWLICRPDFPDRHAYLVVETLAMPRRR